jgi:hypothetical protein
MTRTDSCSSFRGFLLSRFRSFKAVQEADDGPLHAVDSPCGGVFAPGQVPARGHALVDGGYGPGRQLALDVPEAALGLALLDGALQEPDPSVDPVAEDHAVSLVVHGHGHEVVEDGVAGLHVRVAEIVEPFEGEQLVEGVGEGGHGVSAALEDALEELLEGGLEQVVLGLVVMGEPPLGQPRGLADVVHRDVGAPALRYGAQGGIDDLSFA